MSLNLQSLHIPDGWESVLVGEVCDIHNHLRLPISADERQTMQGDFPYYGPTGILDHLDHYRVEGKYALIGEDGDHFLKYKNRAMTLLVEGKFNVNNHAHLVVGRGNCITEWFYHFFRHTRIFPFLSRQGAGRFKLNKASLIKLPILLPPLPEQHKISEILTAWDEANDLVGQQIEAKQQLKKGLMQQLLTGKVRFPRFIHSEKKQDTRFGEIPTDWKYVPISQVADQVLDRNENGSEYPVLSCTKYDGLVDSLEYFGKQIFSDDTSTYKIVKRGHFAYATNHIEEGSIGYQDLYDLGLVSPMYTVFKTNDQVNDGFMFKLLKTELYRQIFEINTNASVNRRGSLRWSGFSKIKIPLPSMNEQIAIASVLDKLDLEIKVYKKKLSLLKKQKQGLMQKLLTGEVRV